MSQRERHLDGRRNPGGRARVPLRLAGVTALAACASAHGGIVDINGGTSWNGWTSIGSSRTNGVWMSGQTSRNFNIYATMFTLEAAQTVGGDRLADGSVGNGVSYTGDSQTSLFSGSWHAGDRIVGVGLRYTDASLLRSFYFMVDWTGDGLRAATSVGSGDGGFSPDKGDISIYAPQLSTSDRFRASRYTIAHGPIREGGASTTPYGTTPTTASPARGFAVLANGSSNAAISTQFFVNLDAIGRSNGGAGFGEGAFGPTTKLGITEAASPLDFTQQTFSIPSAGAIALLGAALLAPMRAPTRRRG